eukprot:6292132-Amphidinium_carterae.1
MQRSYGFSWSERSQSRVEHPAGHQNVQWLSGMEPDLQRVLAKAGGYNALLTDCYTQIGPKSESGAKFTSNMRIAIVCTMTGMTGLWEIVLMR